MTIENRSQKIKIGFWLSLITLSFTGLSTALTSSSAGNGQQPPAPRRGVIDDKEDTNNRPIETMTRGYVSSDSCQECHTHHYGTWHASHHRTMTQVPTKDSVIADFDNKVLVHSGRQFRFFHKNDEYFMEMKPSDPSATGKLASNRVFKIVLMTGAHHQQGFWCETDKARTLAKIPFIWILSLIHI